MQRSKRTVLLTSIVALATVGAFLAAFIATFGAATFVTRNDRGEYLERLYEATSKTVRATIDPRFQSKAEEIARVTNRLVMMEILKGGAILDGTGHLVQRFGESPTTNGEAVARTAARIFPAGDRDRIEFYLPTEETGTPFPLILRIEVAEMTALETMSGTRALALALLAAGATAIAVCLLVIWRVAGPLRRIVSIVERVVADPAQADSGSKMPVGRDEIGALGIVLEQFRSTIANSWRTKVVVADYLLQSAPIGVLQLAMDGTPTQANVVAADILGRDPVGGQNTIPLVVHDLETGTRAVLRDHVERFGSETRLVEIMQGAGTRYAVFGGLVVGRETRTPTYLCLLTDITDFFLSKVAADLARSSSDAQARVLHRRYTELKLSLEACLVLLAGNEKQPDTHAEAGPIVDEWFAQAREADMVSTLTFGNETPQLAGPADDLRAVFRLSLLLAYARIGVGPVPIAVEGKGINFETAGFTVKAQASGVEPTPENNAVADWQLVLAALRSAVRRCGGQLSEFAAADGQVTIRFVLRGLAERVQTAMKGKAAGR